MLNKNILCVLVFTIFVSAGFAQTTDDDYKKNEFFVGYSNQQVNEGSGRSTFNGIEGSYTRNISRYFGIRGTFSYAKNDRTLAGSVIDPVIGLYNFQQTNLRSVYNFLGGVQIKDNATTKRLKPFAYALGGVAHNRNKFENFGCVSTNTPPNCPAAIPAELSRNRTFSDTGIAGAFGGGLDIKINDRIDFRAIQVDYNPIYSNTRVDNNVRFGIGIVFK